MKHTFFLLLGLAFPLATWAQPLSVSSNGRYLVTGEGTPFFWLGDTAWELFHRLTKDEATLYLENRATKGFSVIQAVVLAELDGLNTPNAHNQKPLIGNDPTKPNEAYFEHVDFVVEKATSLGLYIGMLPTWGDKFNKKWGVGPEVFTPENAAVFGEFLGKRYADRNIIWILGGDRNPADEEDLAIVRAMAAGIEKGDGGRHLMTYHPQGGSNSSTWFHEDKWLDFNMFQSGHGSLDNPNYQPMRHNYQLLPTKPTLDGEPRYEDHPVNWRGENGWFAEFDVRQAAWWGVLSGGCGHTYGNHNIWQMWEIGYLPVSAARTPWFQAMDYPGAFQVGYMRHFFEARPWQLLVPAQEMLENVPNTGGKEVFAAKASDGSFAVVYTPYGTNFTLKTEELEAEQLQAWWYNPRNHTAIGLKPFPNQKSFVFDPPADPEKGNDWVLLIESRAAGFQPLPLLLKDRE